MSCLTLNNTSFVKADKLNASHKRMSSPALSNYFESPNKALAPAKCLYCDANNNCLITPGDTVYNKIGGHINNKFDYENIHCLKKFLCNASETFFEDVFEANSTHLGSGANGLVSCYTPKDKEIPKQAVKEFTQLSPNELESDYFKRHANEIYIGAMLEHENIIHAHQFLYQDKRFYLIMEYCPYEFFDMVCSGKLSEEEIDDFFFQLINGVKFLHKNNVVHRDLKLENLMIDANGTLKIVDFGFAAILKNKGKGLLCSGLWGSDPYIAPEMFSTNQYDATKTDIWSIAIIYLALVTGRFAWDVAKEEDHYYAKYLVDSDSIAELIPNKKAVNLIISMLNPDPSKRASMDDIWSDPWFTSIMAKHYERRLKNQHTTTRLLQLTS
ncbi:Pkinase-domain-containing protein [Neoconidiobolus thromboides FSU 785]|nr:Pkinase-domain-containing protein [Neoconidiobolus thromboides FSU 785]